MGNGALKMTRLAIIFSLLFAIADLKALYLSGVLVNGHLPRLVDASAKDGNQE